jgi:hypothetical protein
MPPLTILHGCATIQLTRGLNTLVDAEDYQRFRGLNWFAAAPSDSHYCYACRKGPRKAFKAIGPSVIYLHGEILKLSLGKMPPGKLCDHKNRDVRDNRRDNLRPASSFQNRVNARKKLWRGGKSSEYKGVSWRKRRSTWRAIITFDDKQYELGAFSSEIDAARAYNAAALRLFGEFAKINEGI